MASPVVTRVELSSPSGCRWDGPPGVRGRPGRLRGRPPGPGAPVGRGPAFGYAAARHAGGVTGLVLSYPWPTLEG